MTKRENSTKEKTRGMQML